MVDEARKIKYPPQWHARTGIREDGSFEIGSLPGGLKSSRCAAGHVSANGPSRFQMRYPQSTGSEPTTSPSPSAWSRPRLEVQVADDKEIP